MKKRGAAVLLAGTVLLGCVGCVKVAEVPSTPRAEPAQPTVPTPTPEPPNALEVYQQALKRLLEEHIDPDPELGHYEDHAWETMGEIEFAVCDVDMDDEQELILRHAHDIVAGQYTAVYRYAPDKEELVEEVRGTAVCRFYDNGTMQVDDSHNQGWAWDFWPYTVLKYDEGAREYREVTHVEAIEKDFLEKNEFAFTEYPADVDAEKAGTVYSVGASAPLSQSAYDAWCAETFGRELQVDYLPLTAENVARLC